MSQVPRCRSAVRELSVNGAAAAIEAEPGTASRVMSPGRSSEERRHALAISDGNHQYGARHRPRRHLLRGGLDHQ
ncbi:hypothetical protein chiPu_0031912, partial [Chiloscyllium punctatum]|nr:hypothetical protein [Chiloscyllium punctatum]